MDNAFEVDNPDPIKPDSSCTSNLPDDDEAPTNIDEAFAAILIFGAKHHTPLIYQRKMYNMMNRLFHEMGQPLGKSFDYKRKLFRRTLPRTTVTYVVEDRKTHLAHRIKETAFRRSLFPAHKFKRLFTETRINLREQILFHANHHKDDVGRNLRDAVAQNRDIDIYVYIDGVPPSKSGKDKMIIEAFRLPCCRQLMNLQIIHHDRHFEVFADDLLLGLIEEFNVMPAVKVKLLVADLPERCRLAGKVNFNGEYGCLHCTTNGEARDKGIGYVYPLWTLDAAERDDESYHTLGVIAEETQHAVMGVKEKSLLFKFNGFSITENLPIDPMHLLSGLINYFWVQSTTRLLNNRLAASVKEFVDNYYGDMVVPSDFKRDTREIDVANFKWSEWKQLLLLGGLEIANAFQQRGQPHAAEIWRILMFVVRAMCLPDEWYLSATAGGSLAVALIAKLYGDIEDLLGKESCTPNLHNLSHLPAWREK